MNDPQLKLSAIADQTVAPGKSVDVTASYAGLVGTGYGFIDWGDGKGPPPLGATGGGAVPAPAQSAGITPACRIVACSGRSICMTCTARWFGRALMYYAAMQPTLTIGVAENPSLFTPVFLNIPNSFVETGGTFTLTYSASNPNNDTVTGSGTDADPYDYTPAAGDFTLWTVDGSGDLNQADLNGGGSFINSGVSYPLSSLPTVLEVDGHTWGFYIQVVGGSLGNAVGAISASVTAGDGDPVTATLSNPPPPQESILPFLDTGTSPSSDTSSDSTATTGTSSGPTSASNQEPRLW